MVKTKTSKKPVNKKTVKPYSNVKCFVLDTNIILHSWKSFLSFEDNHVVIDSTVLEEVDSFKKGFESINFNAREFLRELDSLVKDKDLNSGVVLPNKGILKVIIKREKSIIVSKAFPEDKPDNRILSTLEYMSTIYGKDKTILISKDTNIRLKAQALGFRSEDFTTDKAPTLDKQYTGINFIEEVDDNLIDSIYKHGYADFNDVCLEGDPLPNEYFILRTSSGKSAITCFDSRKNNFRLIKSQSVYGITPRNVEQICAIDALLNPEISLVTLQGNAGTGKTLCAIASALACKKDYLQILITKPVISLKDEEVGFLKGDLYEKLDPIFQSYFDNINFIKESNNKNGSAIRVIDDVLKNNKIQMLATAFIRGRSFNRVFIIGDEMQNFSVNNIKTLISRSGQGTKIVLMGDIRQIDSPYLDEQSNGLAQVIDRFKNYEKSAHITLSKGERSELAELASKLL